MAKSLPQHNYIARVGERLEGHRIVPPQSVAWAEFKMALATYLL